MTFDTRDERITEPAGGTFSGHLVLPAGGGGPGVVLLGEIFGTNSYLRSVADRLALLGYVALVPDLFWRIDPDHPLERQEEQLGEAFERVGQLDFPAAIGDSVAALDHLAGLPEVTGDVGVLGFCMGGHLAYGAAAAASPAVAVSYYGSGIADHLDRADDITCPILFHFGQRDDFIPVEQVDAISARLGGRDGVRIETYDAGHAFDNDQAAMFYDPQAARAAWGLSAQFLAAALHP
jgi:carboxymethylenebutenolidase